MPNHNAYRKASEQSSKTSSLSRGYFWALAAQLPLAVPLGMLFSLRSNLQVFDEVMILLALASTMLFCARLASFHMNTRMLMGTSTVLIRTGSRKFRLVLELSVLVLAGAGWAALTLASPTGPSGFASLPTWVLPSCIFIVSIAGQFLARLGPSRQYWLKSVLIMDTRVIPYEDLEALVQVPWQGFDIHLGKNRGIIEIRKTKGDAAQLLEKLKPILTPYGIKMQIRGDQD